MSKAPYYLRRARFGYKAGNDLLIDPNTESQLRLQPEEIFGCIESMDSMAENLINKYLICCEKQDEFLMASQNKAAQTIEKSYFKE